MHIPKKFHLPIQESDGIKSVTLSGRTTYTFNHSIKQFSFT